MQDFREYLKNKYGTIENLNEKWVMHRWSSDYDSFDQILPPSADTWEHPSRQTEWLFFQNELIYLNSLAPIAKGADMNLYWLYLSHKAGHELGHGAILSSCGRPNSAGRTTKKLAQDLEKAKSFLENSKVKSKVALTYSSVSVVDFGYFPTISNLDRNVEERLIENFYDAFRHQNIDVIETEKSLYGYDVVISPMLANLDDEGFKDKILEFVNNGGTWIVGPLFDVMTEYAAKYEHAPYSILEELCGAYTTYQLPVEEKEYTARHSDGTKFNIFLGYDAYELRGAESVATYENVPDLKGLCAIAKNKVGKGQVNS